MTSEAEDKPQHTPDGKFAPGNTLGGQTQRGRATWRNRADQLDDKYPTVESLLALFIANPTTGKMEPGPELLQMHPRDAAIIMQSLGGIVGDDKRAERESYWDRREGKARQSIAVAGDPDNPTPISVEGEFTLTFGTDGNDGTSKG